MGLGIVSLSDVQTDPATWRPFSYQQRLAEIASYRFFAGWLGLPMVLARAGRIGPRDASPRDPRLSIAETLERIARNQYEQHTTETVQHLYGFDQTPGAFRPFAAGKLVITIG